MPVTMTQPDCMCTWHMKTQTLYTSRYIQHQDRKIALVGRAHTPDAPLCAMVKVNDAFMLYRVDEVTAVRPDLSRLAAAAAERQAVAEAAQADADYKPEARGTKAAPKGRGAKRRAAAKPNTSIASSELDAAAEAAGSAGDSGLLSGEIDPLVKAEDEAAPLKAVTVRATCSAHATGAQHVCGCAYSITA